MSEENNKRVHINEDGILSITNDNATWVNGDVTTDIRGDYNISADDLRRLIVMITGQDVMMITTASTWWYAGDYKPKTIDNTIITTNKAIADEIKELHEAYQKKVKSEAAATYDYKTLREKVEKFNKSRHWWERKLEM